MRTLASLIGALCWVAGVILAWMYAWWFGLLAIFVPFVPYFVLVYHLLKRFGFIYGS